MKNTQTTLAAFVENAREKLRSGTFTERDLDLLQELLRRLTGKTRQRLLYLHAREPSVTADVIAMAEHDPARDEPDRLRTRADWQYNSVLDAMRDGWQVIHFPNQLAPFDDRETDVVGFEFILQKLEASDD
jgi:predicted component of type VI protein secretion system